MVDVGDSDMREDPRPHLASPDVLRGDGSLLLWALDPPAMETFTLGLSKLLQGNSPSSSSAMAT